MTTFLVLARCNVTCGGLFNPARKVCSKIWVRREIYSRKISYGKGGGGSNTKTYYDSQSGNYITVGGTVKIHDVTFRGESSCDVKSIENVLEKFPMINSIQIPLPEPVSVLLTGTVVPAQSMDIIIQLNALREKNKAFKNILYYLPAAAATAAVNTETGTDLGSVDGGVGYGYVVDISASSTSAQRNDIINLVKSLTKESNSSSSSAKTLSKHVRTMLSCDLGSTGSSSIISTGGIIGDMADAGSQCIILQQENQDDEGAIDADVILGLIEEGLNLDCAGDPIKQRLGLHINMKQEGVDEALRIAVDAGLKNFTAKCKDHDKIMQCFPTDE